MNLHTGDYQCRTAVALLIFNRPETTELVFTEIAKARPRRLLVVADGPRQNRPGEDEQCQAARRIAERVDWDCELLTNYAATNMGCRQRVSSGIDWIFGQVEEAILLEDDCLPHPSFFRFCDEMLERYRDDERIMSVSGDNFQFGRQRWPYSYYFSRYGHVWGWASWRRAWKHYDVHMSQWPMIKESVWLDDILGDRRDVEYWTQVFEQAHRKTVDTWDYQWVFACWLQSALSVLPTVNLISNIGFGPGATHTVAQGKLAGLRTEPMAFPLNHPPVLVRDARADRYTAELFFRRSLLARARTLIRKWRDGR